jgi:2-hydroxychromene-2-carboxylate isomerase
MEQQFKDQGGAASSEPSGLRRWLTSKMMRRLSDPARRDRKRQRFESRRKRRKEPIIVEYFHQVEDPYSHLAAQLLQPLLDTYDIELVCHLVAGPTGKNAPEPDLLLEYARQDCALVAPHYGLEFSPQSQPASLKRIKLANMILSLADAVDFPQLSVTVGRVLWSSEITDLNALEDHLGAATSEEAARRIAAGNSRRAELGHYSGAMFYCGGEWYWGVDRLYHLENRLLGLSARWSEGRQLLVPRPGIEMGTLLDEGSLTLEIYPSLRSPYTSIIFDKALSLVRATGVKMVLRPVLPMVMRGVPVTTDKGFYIAFDTAREAETLGLAWGNVYDPIGAPVRRAYALFPWAEQRGKGGELLSQFLRAAFFEAVNTNTNQGFRRVVEAAGLDWKAAQTQLDDPEWETRIEENRLAMYEFGSWGVPSFRLLDAGGETLLATWGQDRLWLVARTIQDTLRKKSRAVDPDEFSG